MSINGSRIVSGSQTGLPGQPRIGAANPVASGAAGKPATKPAKKEQETKDGYSSPVTAMLHQVNDLLGKTGKSLPGFAEIQDPGAGQAGPNATPSASSTSGAALGPASLG